MELGGYDLTEDLQLFVHDETTKLTAEASALSDFFVPKPPYWFGEKGSSTAMPLAREIPAKIEVAAKTSNRLVRWQVANANGASPTSVFYVTCTPQVMEDRYRDEPQTLAKVPIGVSGRLSKIAEVDRYVFSTPKAALVTVSLMARRIGADFNGVIEIRDDAGKLVADAADTLGSDIVLSFNSEAKQVYTLSLHDVDFRGHRSMIYNLEIGFGARVITTIPAAMRRGETTDVTFVGYGLQTGKAELESIVKPVRVPKRETFVFPLTTPAGRIAHPMTLTDEPISTDTLDPPLLPIPCQTTQSFDESGTTRHQFVAAQGQTWHVSAVARAISSDADVAITIKDPEGKPVATNDDLEGTSDAGVDFTVPATGLYTCEVTDVSGKAITAVSVYQLTFELQPPSFRLTIPQQLNIPLGGQASLAVKAERFGGCDGEIAINITGLPKGVTLAENSVIPAGKPSANIVVKATPDAHVVATEIQVTGAAKMGENTIGSTARALAAGNLYPRDEPEIYADFALLAVTMKPPFAVEVVDRNRQRAVHRGTTYPAPFEIKRDEGFAGEVRLQMAAKQSRHRQGIRGPFVTVPGNVEQVSYPCFMPEWLETDRTSRMIVQGLAKVADPKGNVRHLIAPANARVTMILEGALMKLAHESDELVVKAGDSFDVPVRVSRSAKFSEPVTIELIPPAELQEVLTCEPITLDSNAATATIKINTLADKRLHGRWSLILRAKALQEARWPVISQTEIVVDFENGLAKPKVASTK